MQRKRSLINIQDTAHMWQELNSLRETRNWFQLEGTISVFSYEMWLKDADPGIPHQDGHASDTELYMR